MEESWGKYGGPAFPYHYRTKSWNGVSDQEVERFNAGMTLRDYVSVKMMQVAILHNEPDEAAVKAHEWADAWLKARRA